MAETDGAAELDAVGAVVEVDQYRERVGGAGLTQDRSGHRLRDLRGERAVGRGAREPDRGPHLRQGARDDSTTEDGVSAGQMGEARRHLPARERLDQRERRLLRLELLHDHALEGLVVLAEDEVADALAHLALHRLELAADVLHVPAARGQLGLELRVVGAEAELHAAVRHQRLHPGEERVHVRLPEAVGVEALQEDGAGQAGLGEQARDDLLLQHAAQLARDAGGEVEARPADVHREAAGGPDRVVDHLRGGRQHGLLAVVGRHHPAPPLEEVLHALEPVLVERQVHPGGLGRDLLREIVHRGPEAAVDDDRVGALARELEGAQQVLPIVADRGLPLHGEPNVLQLLGDIAEIGVDDLSRQHLVARANHLDVQAHLSFRGVGWGLPPPAPARRSPLRGPAGGAPVRSSRRPDGASLGDSTRGLDLAEASRTLVFQPSRRLTVRVKGRTHLSLDADITTFRPIPRTPGTWKDGASWPYPIVPASST